MKRMLLVLVGALLLAACGGTAPASQPGSASAGGADLSSWEKDTYQAALKEGKVVVYGFWNPVLEKIFTEFMAARYPGVQLETLTSPTATEKLRTEAQSGQRIGDVYIGGATSGLTLNQLGLSEQFDPPAEKEGDARYVIPPSSSTSFPQVVYTLQGKGILINTQKVPVNKEPKTWQDLLDPFWAGKKLVIDHPARGSGSGPSWARWVSEQPDLGRPFLEGLMKEEVVLATSAATTSINAVARGEYYGYVPPFPSSLQETRGAPVKFLWLGPKTHGVANNVVLIKQAPHPNAARLFINMTLLSGFQEALTKGAWQTPVRLGVSLPDPIVSFEGHNVYVDNEQDLKRTLDFAGSVAKEIFGQ